jgi:hypothetical protein
MVDEPEPPSDDNEPPEDVRSRGIASSFFISAAGALAIVLAIQFLMPDGDSPAPRPAPLGATPYSSAPVIPAALVSATQEAEAGRWAEAQSLLEQHLATAPPSPGVMHLLAVVATEQHRDIAAAMAYRALAVLDPEAAADPLIAGELDAAVERLAGRAETFFNAAVTVANGDPQMAYLLQQVLERMAAAGQLGLARPLAAQHAWLDLSRALIVGGSEAEDRIGPNFAWALLQLVPDLIVDDALLDVEHARNQLALPMITAPETVNKSGSLVGGRDEAPSEYQLVKRRFAEKPGIYRLQAMGLRWIWYGVALRNISPAEAYTAYWKGQGLIERSGVPFEFLPQYPGRQYAAFGHHELGRETVSLLGSNGSVEPVESTAVYEPATAPSPRPEFATEIVNRMLPMPVERPGPVDRKPLAELEPIDPDALQALDNEALIRRLMDLGYWYSMAVRTLLIP